MMINGFIRKIDLKLESNVDYVFFVDVLNGKFLINFEFFIVYFV